MFGFLQKIVNNLTFIDTFIMLTLNTTAVLLHRFNSVETFPKKIVTTKNWNFCEICDNKVPRL